MRAYTHYSVWHRMNIRKRTDTPQRSKSVVQTVIEAAQDPSKILMFNYASEALNNSFFLQCLVSVV